MRAAIFRKGELVVDTIADPVPVAGQVLVKTLCCGICGSDLHVAKHTRQFVDVANRAGRRWVMDPDRDVVFGHEFCCEVVEHGPDTAKRLKPGTRVCSIPLTVRGETAQGIGYSNEVAGGFAQFMPLAERLLLEVPNGLPADCAALTEPIAVGWHAVQNARLTPQNVALLLGSGRDGIAVTADLSLKNVHPIIAAVFSPARRPLALRMGADIVVHPAEVSPYQSWHDAATPEGYDGSRYAQLVDAAPSNRPAGTSDGVGVREAFRQSMA